MPCCPPGPPKSRSMLAANWLAHPSLTQACDDDPPQALHCIAHRPGGLAHPALSFPGRPQLTSAIPLPFRLANNKLLTDTLLLAASPLIADAKTDAVPSLPHYYPVNCLFTCCDTRGSPPSSLPLRTSSLGTASTWLAGEADCTP